MSNNPDYHRQYYARNKATIVAQRRARYLAMTEQEREKERDRQRERARKHGEKRRAEIELMRAELAELVALANETAAYLETRNTWLRERSGNEA